MSIVAAFVVLVAVALSFLYSETGKSAGAANVDRESMLFSAVPTDASVVFSFDGFGSLLDCLVSDESALRYPFTGGTKSAGMRNFLLKVSASSSLYKGTMSCPAVLSVHNIGELEPLLILDAGRAGNLPSEAVDSLMSAASSSGLVALFEDASEYAPSGNPLKKRSLLLISPSDILVESSLRHLKAEVSVLDTDGFGDAAGQIASGNMAVIPDSGIRQLSRYVLSRKARGNADFAEDFAGCTAFMIRTSPGSVSMTGKMSSDRNQDLFVSVFRKIKPSASEVSSVLPSYTVYAMTVPVHDVSAYAEAYLGYAETRSLSKDIKAARAGLKKSAGQDPVEWAVSLDIKEVAAAAFVTGGSLEKVLLVRTGKSAARILSENQESPDNGIFEYKYKGYLASLFGEAFSLQDESSFMISDRWMIIGSRKGLSEYSGGRATDYTLSAYLADAGVEDLLSSRNTYLAAYVSLSEDQEYTASVFSEEFLPAVRSSLEGVSYEPVFFNVREDKSGLVADFNLFRTDVLKSQAPAFERDTVVAVPEGPFRVRNSGTGKWNLFYQQENLYLCLQEEGGKGLWGVPFSAPICGCAQTVDYFANGKLQILFASGTKLYLIDRLGRFVNPFPVDLGKEILVGPDVYDFSGNRRYNVIVLHTDNTIEMYNLQGRRPAQWKTITAPETIKGLPERIKVGGRTYWIVRTSIQTLIFQFYGGVPLTVLEGDRMIRPDSEISPSGDDAVEAVCYDGKKHIIKLHTK